MNCKLRIKSFLPSILTLILIAVLSLIPAREFPETDVPFADKWVHWVMYAWLTAVFLVDYCRKGSMCPRRSSKVFFDFVSTSFAVKSFKWFNAPSVRSIVFAMLISSLYGGLMEVLQATVTTTRSGDWLDFLADAFGALCAGTVFFISVLCSRCRA